jgi:hypothetical protein
VGAAEQSELLANRLEKAGVPHRFIKLPWARHPSTPPGAAGGSQTVRHELGEFLEKELAD